MSSPPPETATAAAPERGPGFDPALLEYALLIRGLVWGSLRREPFNLSYDGLNALKEGRSPARNVQAMETFKRVVALLEERYPVKPAIEAMTVRPT